MSKIFLLALIVPIILTAQQKRFRHIPIDIKSLDDTTNYVDIKEYHLRVIFPKGEIRNPPYQFTYEEDNGSVRFSPSVQYGDFTLEDFSINTLQSVRRVAKLFEKFISEGGELQGDSNPPETEVKFSHRQYLLSKDSLGGFYDEFTTVNGRKFGHRRYRDEPCGCFVSDSYTFIGKTRVTISLMTYGDSVKQQVEKSFHDEMGDNYNYGDKFQQSISKRMRAEYLNIISRIRIVEY